MSTDLPPSLRSLVTTKFKQAQASQELTFSNTELATLQVKSGISFQLRYCPSLAKKPTDNKPKPSSDTTPKKPKFDPFENPTESLLVTPVPIDKPTHNIVLNKFPVIREHLILATKENKPQTHLLEVEDLRLTYECVKAWHEGTSADAGHSLFAFFNSGEHSGASQPHRHVQFLPIEAMRDGQATGWNPLTDQMIEGSSETESRISSDPRLPIAHFAVSIDQGISAEELHDRYITLLKRAYLASSKSSPSLNKTDLEHVQITNQDNHEVRFSYNLALTKDVMAILPRRSEAASLSGLSDDENMVAINGTILAGTLMVKSEKQWDLLKTQPELMDDLLQQIGFPVDKLQSPFSGQTVRHLNLSTL